MGGDQVDEEKEGGRYRDRLHWRQPHVGFEEYTWGRRGKLGLFSATITATVNHKSLSLDTNFLVSTSTFFPVDSTALEVEFAL